MTSTRPTSLLAWLAAIVLATAGNLAAAQPAPATPAGKKPAAAAEAQPEPDTLILSDTLNYDDIKKESVFTGNVILTRGLMTLRADKLVVSEDPEGFQHGTATVGSGKLVYVRQEDPAKFEVLEAQGLRGEYNGKTEEIEMIGQAVVTRFVCGKQFDRISGERVKFNQKNNTYQAFSGPNSAAAGGRVRSVAAPRAKADAAAAQCQQKSAKG
jgi:lipopolysaccharide export system protein LptA